MTPNCRRLVLGIVSFAILLLFSPRLLAQAPTGSIEGSVTDATGAVIAGAAVTITEKATGRVINLTSNGSGYFEARALPPGQYTVKIAQQGFSPEVIENVRVEVGQVANATVALKPGGTQEVVNVQANSEVQVDTVRSTVDGVITSQQIDQLPLNARNFMDLAKLEPGVNVRDGGTIDPTKTFAFRTVGVSGRGGTGTRVQFDGIDVTDETVGTTTANLSDDAIREFQLSRSSFDLSTSLSTSGAISVVTKSGGNQVHGGAFFFGQNQDFSALKSSTRQLDANGKDQGNPPFHRNQVGFNAGGPFIKDKLFWFASWERFYQADAFTTDPSSVTAFPQMAGNASLPSGIRYASGRVDWNVSNAVRMFYRFNHNWDISTGGTAQSPFQNLDWTNVSAVGADITQTRLTHSFRFGYVRFHNQIISEELPQFKFNVASNGIPYFLGVGQYQLGPNGLAPQQTYQANYQTKYDGSYTRGKHTFRYGGEVNRIVLGGFANFAGPLSVAGTFTAGPVHGGNPQDPLQYPLESFSTGPANGFFTVPAAHGFPHGGNYNTRLAWYAGDNVHLLHNLTLNFGLRWEYDTGYFNKEKEDGARRPPILAQVFPPAATPPHFPKDAFGPTFGFAWDPKGDGKTVIRGGAYKAYEMNIFNNTLFNEFALLPPGIGPDSYDQTGVFGPDGTPINVDGKHPTGDYTDLVGQPIGQVINLIAQIHAAVNQAYLNHKFDPSQGKTLFEISRGNTFGAVFPGDFKIPYSMQFNVGVQRQIGQHNMLTVDYVRNHAVGLPYLEVDYQHRRDASTLNVAAAKAKVASVLGSQTFDQWFASFPAAHNRPANIGDMKLASDSIFTGSVPGLIRARIMSGGFSLYSALQAKLVGRLADKLWIFRSMSYQASYALGHSLASCASGRVEFINGTCDNHAINNPAYFGHTAFSNRHVFAAGVVTETPGGVRVSQIWTYTSRGPFSINIPSFAPITGANAMFTTDLNGDGGTGSSPRGDTLPGLVPGGWGRDVSSISGLNKLITAFNQNFAGKPTPEGAALINAGIFTLDQLKKLGAVMPVIPLVPASNPNPFASNPFNLDLRITRPIRIENARIVHNLTIEPYFDAFNVFNYRGESAYGNITGVGALSNLFGSLNYDYAAHGELQKLRNARSFAFNPRVFQLGFRVSF
jgi:hypothetical protein